MSDLTETEVLARVRAMLDDDTARRRAWAPGFEAFFPDGSCGSDFLAIHFVPDQFEVIDFGHGINPEPYGLASLHVRRDVAGWSIVPSALSPES